eukprot:TRINITY_DN1716_c0_g1_i13.p1 TRINITY_DN1716_c0_g1~~TRINITY_DN1716_c0_g1_i13.p1  ORF type:complete len:156 (-),score=3.01 TRINITY_DN1716_c0_g1_i13:262-729(-)
MTSYARSGISILLLGILLMIVYPAVFRKSFVSLSTSVFRMASSTARPQEQFSMAFVTAPNAEEAKKIAGGLVSGKLAACVNIIPGITSVYEWEGKIETDPEVLMMIKTRTSRIPELTEFVRKNHPYDVCEVITTSIEGGNQPYLDWLAKTVPEKM